MFQVLNLCALYVFLYVEILLVVGSNARSSKITLRSILKRDYNVYNFCHISKFICSTHR